MLKILYKYYPLAYVILYRETTRKACVLGNESGADQRKSVMFHDSLYSFLYTAVCLHTHLEKSQVDLGNTIFLSLLQANMYMKNL